MAASCVVHSEPTHVDVRLADLGVDRHVLAGAVADGVAFVTACTANDPPNLVGLMGWGKITRGLRDRIIPRGGKRKNVRGQAATVTSSGASIVVASGNADTGVVNGKPATKSAKGPATEQAVQANAIQGSLTDVDPRFAEWVKTARSGPLTWFLLYRVDGDNALVHYELALSDHMDDDGYLDSFIERIILTPLPLNQAPVTGDSRLDEEPETAPEIAIERRAGSQ